MAIPRIVIVGAGFGGLAVAKALKKTPAEVILIDRTNHHLFQPFALSGGDLGARARVRSLRPFATFFVNTRTPQSCWAKSREWM